MGSALLETDGPMGKDQGGFAAHVRLWGLMPHRTRSAVMAFSWFSFSEHSFIAWS